MFVSSQNPYGSQIDPSEMSFNTIREVLSTTLTGVATSIEMSGLDLDADGTYFISFELANDGAAGWDNVAMYCNLDTTATNYHSQLNQASHNTWTGARSNNGSLIFLYSSTKNHATAIISKVAGEEPVAVASGMVRPDANIVLWERGWAWTGTANVTKLTFTNSETNGFGIGTVVKIYKVV